MSKAPKPISGGSFAYSPEQEAVLQTTESSYIVSANAGSGKTETMAEKAVRLLVEEIYKRFPGHPVPPTVEQVTAVLDQMLLVTFTKKAAEELDARVKRKMKARNIPIPQHKSEPVRICRTLDSFLQMWVKKPAFFEAWMQEDKPTADALSRLVSWLPAETQAAYRMNDEQKPTQDPRRTFFLRSSPLLSEAQQNVLIDYLICMELRLTVPYGFDLANFQKAFQGFLATVQPGILWPVSPLQVAADAHTKWSEAMIALDVKAKQAPLSLSPQEEEALEKWVLITESRAEFMSVHEIARGRSYHPERYRGPLGSSAVLRALACCEHIQSLRHIHSISAGYLRLKRHFGWVDFGDFLSIFLFVVSTQSGGRLLDRNKEYPSPRMSVRRKIVLWDEGQDNNPGQFTVREKFMPNPGVPFFSMIIGDPFQSLYSFRGSNPELFIKDIESLRENTPDRLLGLTCSFRSAKEIVKFGNAVLARLSKANARPRPSRTVHDEEGEIIVSPYLPYKEDEANWVCSHIARLDAKNGGNGSYMIVARSGLAAHPIAKKISELNVKHIQLLTVHAAKGLEADHVFVIDCMAGKFPDPRSSIEQEANAFYVAVTRARRTLFLSSAMKDKSVDENGQEIESVVGPSPYWSMIPEIRERAINAKWSQDELDTGTTSHMQAFGAFMTAIKKRINALQAEAQGDFASIEPSQLLSTHYLGAVSPFEHIAVKATLPAMEGASDSKEVLITAEEKSRVFAKLKKAYFSVHRPPTVMSAREKMVATQQNWIEFKNGVPIFPPSFRQVLAGVGTSPNKSAA